jgi:hypothetical protein
LVAWIAASFAALVLFLAGAVEPIQAHNAKLSIDSSNLRQIGTSAMLYAADHRGQLPSADSLSRYAAELARSSGLNDAQVWISSFAKESSGFSTIVDGQGQPMPYLNDFPFDVAVVSGLREDHLPTTPVAWTRGLQTDGTWVPLSSKLKPSGAIVFLSGEVRRYPNLHHENQVVAYAGGLTSDIRATLPPGARILERIGLSPSPESRWQRRLQSPALALAFTLVALAWACLVGAHAAAHNLKSISSWPLKFCPSAKYIYGGGAVYFITLFMLLIMR